jgi:hypothetical protein
MSVEHRSDGCRIREIRADDERAHADLAQLRGELLSTRRLVAEVDDDVCTGLREVADGVRADPAGRAGDQRDLSGQGTCGQNVGHGDSSCDGEAPRKHGPFTLSTARHGPSARHCRVIG